MKAVRKLYDSLYSKSTILAFLILMIAASIVFHDRNFLSFTNIFNILLKAAKTEGFWLLA